MVISNSSFHGPGNIPSMGFLPMTVEEEAGKDRLSDSRGYPLAREAFPEALVKQEETDDVPDLDADEYSPRLSLDQQWYMSSSAGLEPQYSLPPESIDQTRDGQYRGFCSTRPLGFRWDMYRGAPIQPPSTAGSTPLEQPHLQDSQLADTAGPLEKSASPQSGEELGQQLEVSVAVKEKRAKNAAAARRSRARQTVRVQTLETKLESLSTENMCLRYEVEKLRTLVDRLQTSLLGHGLSLDEDPKIAPPPLASPGTNEVEGTQ